MRAFVFTDPALASEAGRFVWLAMNTERAENAAMVKRLKVQALPTFFVLDPSGEQVLARRVGGMTTAQLREFLDAAHATYTGRDLEPADRMVARAESLHAAGDTSGAIASYEEALAAGGPSWTGRPRTVESLLFALAMAERFEPCARLALTSYPEARRTPAAANVAATGLDCALSLPEDHAERAALIETLLAAAREVTTDLSIPVVADDRSGAFGTLIGAHEALGDTVEAHRVTEAWATFLENEAAQASTPDERAVFDSHRLSAYLELGEPERALPMLQASERDLPDDYNPPARLAVVYFRMKQLDEALAASDRAVAKAYGPRKLRVLETRADIMTARADTAGATRALEEALALAESLPEGQRSESAIARLRKRLGGG